MEGRIQFYDLGTEIRNQRRGRVLIKTQRQVVVRNNWERWLGVVWRGVALIEGVGRAVKGGGKREGGGGEGGRGRGWRWGRVRRNRQSSLIFPNSC